jgi:hypothetical protein
MAAVIIGASGMLQATGQPLFVVAGEVALNLAAVQSEAERLRRKARLLRLDRIQQELATEVPPHIRADTLSSSTEFSVSQSRIGDQGRLILGRLELPPKSQLEFREAA